MKFFSTRGKKYFRIGKSEFCSLKPYERYLMARYDKKWYFATAGGVLIFYPCEGMFSIFNLAVDECRYIEKEWPKSWKPIVL
jgi:hypothetical protein